MRRFREDIIKRRISDMGLTDQDVVRLVQRETEFKKFSTTTLVRVLRGDNARFDTVWAIAKVLNLSRVALVDPSLKERDFDSAVLNGSSTRRK